MLLTCFYMASTFVQARKVSNLRAHLYAAIRERRSSVVFDIINFPEDQNEDNSGHIQKNSMNSMSSQLCLSSIDKNTANIGKLLWSQENMKLCVIQPQQQIDVSDWLTYPYGFTMFPVSADNCCQIFNKTDSKIYILVEINQKSCDNPISVRPKIYPKLEDYGLLVMWTITDTLNVILETDVEHTIYLINTLMKGQHYFNNGLLLLRIQSILITGQPCAYDSEQFKITLDRSISNITRIIAEKSNENSNEITTIPNQTKFPETLQLYDVKPIPKDLKIETIPLTSKMPDEVAANIIKKNVKLLKFPESLSESLLSIDEPIAINEEEKSDSLTKDHSSVEKTDNILLDTNNKVCTKNITEVKHKLSLNTTSILSEPNFRDIYHSEPPNVAIYAESPDMVNNVKSLLQKILDQDRYIIYVLSREEARSDSWRDEVSLFVVCGNVDAEVSAQLVEYIVDGGKLLVLCSNMLHTLLPVFKTAEVRENELVYFSYGKWNRVRLMHHIFCYHASPIRTRFSQDNEDTSRNTSYASLMPKSIKDKDGKTHSLIVNVLGTEETWHNPSILFATLPQNRGKAIFSQIHLEVDPMQYEHEEEKFKALKESDTARLEIICDILKTHLKMEITNDNKEPPSYTPAYLYGHIETKHRFFANVKKNYDLKEDNILQLSKLKIQWLQIGQPEISASATSLPILMFANPTKFNSSYYFTNLETRELGRLVIFSDILTSTMNVIEKRLSHGLVVIARKQTKGQGRGHNIWLSPLDSVAFSIQINIPIQTYLGKYISLLQHIVTIALVTAVKSQKGYEDIDLRIKWPNDIYAGDNVKIGGVIINSYKEYAVHVCNIGVGMNLNNDKPTTCINALIRQYNEQNGTSLKFFHHEDYLPLVFNQLERLIDYVQMGNMRYFYKLYYKYWMHSNTDVNIINSSGEFETVTILGINDYGFLLVKRKEEEKSKIFSVQPNGNTFDIFKGLIAPK